MNEQEVVSVTYTAESEPGKLPVMGVGFACVSVLVFYFSIVGFYVSQRSEVVAAGGTWLPKGVEIGLTQPNYMGLTLFFSLITCWWMVSAVKNNDFSNAYIAYALTIFFGIAYIIQTTYLFTLMELVASESETAVLIYSLIIAHLLISAAGIIYMIISAVRTVGGEYNSSNYVKVVGPSMFWTLAVVLYSVLWFTVYITK